ncbi:MAG: putative multidrug resistance protein NorM [Alphaproteobacteria bacterium]|nr:MAG: putative multidrug resistance protein NorM [Alphaproteobacteria bacterium]
MATAALASQERLPWRGHVAATLKLGLPLIGAQIAQIAIATTDTVMIGWLGARELAASVLGVQGFFVALMLGSGFALAVMPLVAQAQGAGDVRSARRATRMGLWIVALYAVVMMLPLWNFEALLVALGQDPHLSAQAADYLRIMQWSLFPALFTFTLRSFLSAIERPRMVLVATVLAAVLNGFANYALIFGNWGAPALGLRGAAIASVLSSTLSFTLLWAYAMWTPAIRRFEIHVRLWRADWPVFGEVLHLGWPISLTIIAEVALFAAASILIGWVGPVALAAHGIALQLASLAFMVPLGLSSAATIRVGRALGAGEYVDLRRAAVSVLILAVAFMALSATAFLAVPEPLTWLFLDAAKPDAAQVAAYAVGLLAVAATFQLVDGVQVVATGLLRGLKDTRVPMTIAVFSYWVAGMPLAYVLAFPAGLGGVGVWFGLAAGLAFAAVLLTARFFWKAARYH